MDDARRIWWIAGYPKSGTTWLRLVLDTLLTGRFSLNDQTAHVVKGDTPPHAWQTICPWPVREAPEDVLQLLRPAALCNLIAQAEGNDILLKTHAANVNYLGVPCIPPCLTKGAIYVLRDPRDIVLSWAEHAQVTADQAIDLLLEGRAVTGRREKGVPTVQSSWPIHVLTWVYENSTVPHTAVVRYEDLLERPETLFRQLVGTMGRTFSDGRWKLALEATRFENLQRVEAEEGFLERKGGERFFRVGKAGQWENGLTTEQVRRIEAGCGRVMLRAGYGLAECVESDLAEPAREVCRV